MAVYIRTSRQTQGRAYCSRYPQKANDLWVVTSVNGKKHKEHFGAPTPENRARAEARRGELEEALRIESSGRRSPLKPRLSEFVTEYVAKGMHFQRLAESTMANRRRQLAPDGPLLSAFGDYRLEAVDVPVLLDWWETFVLNADRTEKTGRDYLDCLSGVYRYALHKRIVDRNPVDAVRSALRASQSTKAARQEKDLEAKPQPIESIVDLQAFVATSENWHRIERTRHEGERQLLRDTHVMNLLQLDAGLRLGEVLGLRWRHVWWGKDEDDITRHLRIEEAIAKGRWLGPPKSGRTRKVALSRRLRSTLLARRLELGRPGDDERVLLRKDPDKYRGVSFARICRHAGIGPRRPKDLRDTFASQLLTAGVQLGYISRQLGHSNVAITARHYARYVDEEGYRAPMQVRPGRGPRRSPRTARF
ncbi:MAG: site-specific integrase [Myxococcota bacterium]